MVTIRPSHEIDTLEMRTAYCNALMNEAAHNDRVIGLHCDLVTSMGLKPFHEAFPERSFNLGIQEANACSMAGGMSAAGLIPFFHTFSVFASRRVYDQIFMSCTYPDLNVKIIGGDAGVSTATNGGTHMPFEDVGILRVMPNITVMEPSDSVMLKSLVHQMAETYGVQYMRLSRKALPKIYEEGTEFTIGKAMVIREGSDATIITCGIMVYEALKAAQALAEEGIEVRVVDMFTIKPIDKACIIDSAKQTGAIVTVENHQKIGGLGSAVAEVLCETIPTPMERVGINDEFGEVGSQDYLMDRFGLTVPYIVEAVKEVIERKIV